jgi:hypothetical protein
VLSLSNTRSGIKALKQKLSLQLLNWRLSDTTAELQLTNAYKAQQEELLYRLQTEVISLQTQLGLSKPKLMSTNQRLARSGN